MDGSRTVAGSLSRVAGEKKKAVLRLVLCCCLLTVVTQKWHHLLPLGESFINVKSFLSFCCNQGTASEAAVKLLQVLDPAADASSRNAFALQLDFLLAEAWPLRHNCWWSWRCAAISRPPSWALGCRKELRRLVILLHPIPSQWEGMLLVLRLA